MAAPSSPTTIAGLNASTGTTTLALVVLLIVLGAAMVLTAVWLVRVTRTDVPALGPLEMIGTRGWRRGDADRRTALLADARPAGAPDPAPTVPYGDDAQPTAAPAPVAAAAPPDPVAVADEPERAAVEEQPVATPDAS